MRANRPNVASPNLAQKLQVEFEKPFNKALKLAAKSLNRISILRGDKSQVELEQNIELPKESLVDEKVYRR